MIKYIAILSLLFGSVCLAEVDTRGLSKEQEAKLQIQAEQMKKEQGLPPEKPVVERAKDYVELGQMIGQALGSTAHEMNIAVNEFAQSTVGKFTMVVIAYKLVGHDILQIMVGSGVLIFGTMIWIYLYRRMCLIKSITIDEKKNKTVLYYTNKDLEPLSNRSNPINVTRSWMLIMLVVLVAASQIIMWA